MAAGAVSEDVHLLINDERFVLEQQHHPGSCVILDRQSGELRKGGAEFAGKVAASMSIHGVIGVVRLLAGPYLLVITDREEVGRVREHVIYRIKRAEMLSFGRNLRPLSEQQRADEHRYTNMIKLVLDMGLYFSYTFDITQSLQRQSSLPAGKPLHTRADDRFFWNKHAMRDFIRLELDSWVLPVMMGFVEIEPCTVNKRDFTIVLISRRSIHRCGVRYHSRGIDECGNVSNYVETEQAVLYDADGQHRTASLVQTRGSIPLYWDQSVNLKYKPKPAINIFSNTAAAFRAHFEDQIKRYGAQVCVSLIDQKGSELALGEAFGLHANELAKDLQGGKLRYLAFDFHHECRKMRYDRLSLLMEKIEADLDSHGYLLADKGVNEVQKGVIRTNCIDCLDRTNVVQTLIARRMLVKQLRRFGIFEGSDKIESHLAFDSLLKNLWANNADAVSLQYSGTGALKTDYTRTGKRTTRGALQDGWNSATRYYLNNFKDGEKQDALDLFVGNFIPDPAGPSPFVTHTALSSKGLVTTSLVVGVVMTVASLLAPQDSLLATHRFAYAALWAGLSAVSLRHIFANGREYVDVPQLSARKADLQKSEQHIGVD
eukprot:tig00000842_g4823.t1